MLERVQIVGFERFCRPISGTTGNRGLHNHMVYSKVSLEGGSTAFLKVHVSPRDGRVVVHASGRNAACSHLHA